MTGEWPSGDVDHINGDKADNRWVNLRDVPHFITARNMPLNCANTSGVNGVHWHRQRGKSNAKIKVNGKTISLGLFAELADAATSRASAEVEYGFTAIHGRY